jgi:hypothetical protein
VASLVFGLSACASPTSFRKDAETLSSSQATVFGRIGYIALDGTRGRISRGLFNLLVQRENDPEVFMFSIGDSGAGETAAFFWSLPPGEYMILGFYWAGNGAPLRVKFTVPPKPQAQYIGDLLIRFSSLYTYDFALRDEFAGGVEAFRSKFPDARIAPERAIGQIEKDPGRYARVVPICDASWGLECTREYSGVRSVYPQDPKDTVVDSVAPTLKWSASPGVTYDVVVYEEVGFGASPVDAVRRTVLGRLARYAQNLTQPMLKVNPPLRPNTSYQWSVRLRRGDTVSTWSQTSHARPGVAWMGFPVVWFDEYQAMFGFTTPDG